MARVFERMVSESGYAERAKALLRLVGYDPTHWVRVVAYRECKGLVDALGPERLDVLEVSAGPMWRKLPFKSYRTMDYPHYDICRDTLQHRFDLIIADNVFEHLASPYRAAQNIHKMLKEDGRFLNITPFMVRIHDVPIDCWRWTPMGMRYFLEESGFEVEVVGSWGSRACVRANLHRWVRRGWFRSLKNEPDVPVQVWALARRAM